ncbi:UNVERIFIED_ORG: hypothetical protein ABIC48_005402 [Burkholderia territorii]
MLPVTTHRFHHPIHMGTTARTILKAILSIPIAFGLAYPLVYPSEDGGVLGEIAVLGPIGSIVVVAVFLALVYAYASDLRTILKSVSRGSRVAEPNSVWLMFLLPYNFIEDFFVISNVAKSLEAESRINPALSGLRSFGRISGIGWCAAQVLSLIPNIIGSIAGVVAVFLWVWHWVFVRRTNKMLAGSRVSVATLPGRTGS